MEALIFGGDSYLEAKVVLIFGTLHGNPEEVLVFGVVLIFGAGVCHGTHVADGSQPDRSKHDNTEQQASTPPRTQQHMAYQLHQHFATRVDPFCSLHKAANHVLLERTRKIGGSKKRPRMRKHGAAVFAHARVRTRGAPCAPQLCTPTGRAPQL